MLVALAVIHTLDAFVVEEVADTLLAGEVDEALNTLLFVRVADSNRTLRKELVAFFALVSRKVTNALRAGKELVALNAFLFDD